MVNKIGIFWFRQDLRLNDNRALNELIKNCDKIIPIYILDDKFDLGGASKWWLYQSLNKLKESLIKKNSQLYFFKGSPKKILNKLLKNYKVKYIYWNRLYDQYLLSVIQTIKKN